MAPLVWLVGQYYWYWIVVMDNQELFEHALLSSKHGLQRCTTDDFYNIFSVMAITIFLSFGRLSQLSFLYNSTKSGEGQFYNHWKHRSV